MHAQNAGSIPMSRRMSYSAAAAVLAERDPVVASLVAEAGPTRLRKPVETHFATLVESIVYQQLAGRAAAAIGRPRSAAERPRRRVRRAGSSADCAVAGRAGLGVLVGSSAHG